MQVSTFLSKKEVCFVEIDTATVPINGVDDNLCDLFTPDLADACFQAVAEGMPPSVELNLAMGSLTI
jgi:hypothetical protein